MAQILKDMGITEYEPRVINQMLEFAYSKRRRGRGLGRGLARTAALPSGREVRRETPAGEGKCCRVSVGGFPCQSLKITREEAVFSVAAGRGREGEDFLLIQP